MSSTPVTFQDIRGILLDIEGTTSSIRFVYDEMFPYVRRHLNEFLTTNWSDPELQQACDQIAIDSAGTIEQTPQAVAAEVLRQMDADLKATGLKNLQGQIWKSGFENGNLVAHIYDDVEPALRAWKAARIDLRIYSSGSVAAQKLFFGHTQAGNLLDLFTAHYDTTTGAKREPVSYEKIARDFQIRPAELLFLSDVSDELDAAMAAGWQVALALRPGNKPQDTKVPAMFHSFEQLLVIAGGPRSSLL